MSDSDTNEPITKCLGYSKDEHICSELAVQKLDKQPEMFAFYVGWLIQRTLWASWKALDNIAEAWWRCARHDLVTLCCLCQAHGSTFHKSTGELFQQLFNAYEEKDGCRTARTTLTQAGWLT